MRKITTALLTGSALLFTACGGGGGGGDNPPPVETYTYDLNTFLNAAQYNFTFEGNIESVQGSIDASGTLYHSYEGEETVDGIAGHNQKTVLTMNNIISTSYSFVYEGYTAASYNELANIYCETTLSPSDVTPVPTNAKIGYVSNNIPLQCEDLTTGETSFENYLIELKSAGGSNATLNVTHNRFDRQGGTLQDSTVAYITVTPNMDMVNVETVTNSVSQGFKSTLHSTSITQ